jgi:hypothetical protein
MSDNDTAPAPFPSAEEHEALILEFQRLAARLARAGLLSRTSSTRLLQSMGQRRTKAEATRHELPHLILTLLEAIEDGTLEERVDYVRDGDELVGLHLESTARALWRARRGTHTAREVRHLLHFGWLHLRDVVVARSERMMFGPEEDRRRAVVLHLPRAHEFVGSRPPAVPFR